MNESHLAYLSLGSNIQPEIHLVKGIELLEKFGTIEKISRAWESHSVGARGPNYLNACLALATTLPAAELKRKALIPIEAALGRRRDVDKFAPRTIDIDIVVFDNISLQDKYWDQAFVVIPFAEIYPDFQNPTTQERIVETARRLRQTTWMEARPGALGPFGLHRAGLNS
jgi:2-amino-4-hydroxy-6-hydroxymethyldihydropteridine diphosphokinase